MTVVPAAANPLDLVRADLAGFAGYRSARGTGLDGDVWLNANEAPWANLADEEGRSRRYPEPQPGELHAGLAQLYGCQPEQLLAGRGSDEAVDILVRALCRPGRDVIVVTPPTFGMYAVCARLHGTAVVEVPLVDVADGFECDFQAVTGAALASRAKLVFLCSPGNPTGNVLPLAAVARLADSLRGHALVVVDEAYGEFASARSALSLIPDRPNIAVLRTLSKAHALAGARIGCVVADPGLIAMLQRCQAPYPLPAPSIVLACRALEPAARAATEAAVVGLRAERERVAAALAALAQVRRVYRSHANFLLVRFGDAQAAFDRLLSAGIVVRDQRQVPGLEDALRITIGSAAQNDRVISAIGSLEATP